MKWFRYRNDFDCYSYPDNVFIDPKKPIVIGQSVGKVEGTRFAGGNQNLDVIKIQHGLNRMPVAMGGPKPYLVEDGSCGRNTRDAIVAFQQKQFPGWPPDGHIDPGEKTIKRMNQIIKENPWPRDDLVKRARENAPIALARVNDALHRLDLVASVYSKPDSLFAGSAAKREADWHFKFHRAADPLLNIRRVQQIYRRMNAALSKFISGSYPLFVLANRPQGSHDGERGGALAYAPLGGYHFVGNETHETEPAGYIYIADERFGTLAVMIHELGHFCGGRFGSGEQLDHVSSPHPKPDGIAKEHGTQNYRHMTPQQALNNVYSYQVYALPEMGFTPPEKGEF